jgi:hypothetical protein
MPGDPSSASSVGSERINLRTSTGVQSATTVNFGTLVWIAGNRMCLRVDSALRPLEAVSLRVDLSPTPGTALLEATVMRALAGAPGDPETYLLRLDRIAPVDEPSWRRFLTARQAGGTLSDLSDVRGSNALATGYHSGSTSTPPARATSAIGGLGVGAPGDTTSGIGGNSGRLAMREALRSAIQRSSSTSGSTRAPVPVPAPPPGSAPVPTPIARPEAPRPAAAPRSDLPGRAMEPEGLAWVASNLAGRQYLEVRWLTPAAFAFDLHTQLAANSLTLQTDGRALPTTPPIFLVLRRQALVVQTEATPLSVSPTSVSYALTLTPAQLADLRAAVRSPPRT